MSASKWSPVEQYVLDHTPRRRAPTATHRGRPRPTPDLHQGQIVEILSGPHAHRIAVVYGPGKAQNMWIAGFRSDTEIKKFGIEPGHPVVVYLHWNQYRPFEAVRPKGT